MNRRSVILAFAATGTAGCTSLTGGEDGPSEQPTDTSTDRPSGTDTSDEPNGERERTIERNAVLDARWVEYKPDDVDVDPYPTDEPPIRDYGVLVQLFDRAAEQDEWGHPGTRTRTVDPRLGEMVGEEISKEKGREIGSDLRGLDNWSDEGLTGRYFDHDSTLIVFKMVFQE